MRSLFKLLVVSVAAAFLLHLWLGGNEPASGDHQPSARKTQSASARVAPGWGNPASLPDHFARHGRDFGARNTQDYARMASEFLQRAKSEGLPAKVDGAGVLRVYDRRSGAFGAYNRDGTTKTYFKPRDSSYFARQPGRTEDLRTWRQR